MNFSFKESDVEDLIWSGIKDGGLSKRGLSLPNGHYFRQVNLPGCGIFDLVSTHIHKFITEDSERTYFSVIVYELKRDRITCANVGQLSRYVDCLRKNEFALRERFEISDLYGFHVRGILVGAGIERDAYHTLEIMGRDMEAFEFSVCLNRGLCFQNIQGFDSYEQVNVLELPKISPYRLIRSSFPFRTDYTKPKLPF